VDIGGTKIAVGIVDERGAILSKMETPTLGERGYGDGLGRIIKMLREVARQTGVQLSGIGIGSTGWVYPFSGEFGDVDFLPAWKGCNPVKDLERAFGVRVALENDGDAAVLGYKGLDGVTRCTRLEFSPHPDSLTPGEATFQIKLDPKEEKSVFCSVACERDPDGARPLMSFPEAFTSLSRDFDTDHKGDCQITTSSETFNDWVTCSRRCQRPPRPNARIVDARARDQAAARL